MILKTELFQGWREVMTIAYYVKIAREHFNVLAQEYSEYLSTPN